jgi:hypothetical protein
MIRGNAVTGLRLLLDAGASVRAARAVEFTAGLVRTFWHYALGRLSEERVALLEVLMEQAPSLWVLVELDDVDIVPAAVRLTELKGEVSPTKRQPHQLRRAMGPPQIPVLNFVHTADEPADLVRELGLLFGDDDRRGLLHEAMTPTAAAAPAALALCRKLVEGTPRSPLDLRATAGRLREEVAIRTASDPASRHDVTALLEQLAAGEGGVWPQARRGLTRIGVSVSVLDEIVMMGWTVPSRRAAPEEPFPTCERRHWEDYLARGAGRAPFR